MQIDGWLTDLETSSFRAISSVMLLRNDSTSCLEQTKIKKKVAISFHAKNDSMQKNDEKSRWAYSPAGICEIFFDQATVRFRYRKGHSRLHYFSIV